MIARLKADFPVTYLCRKLGVSASGFYDWAAAPASPARLRRARLTELVLVEFAKSNRVAGYRKVAAAIRRGGEHVDRKTVARLMRELGLMAPLAVRSMKTARRRARRFADPIDLLDRDFSSVVAGSILVGDITYVPTGQGWLYVATVIDLASRSVLGFATGTRMTTSLVIRALDAAISTGQVVRGAVFHSDHGTQYRSKRFTDHCGQHGIHRSMGDRMQCWDNAAAESFFSKLKGECLDEITFKTRAAATTEVVKYINHYNTERLHQTLDYQTPAEKLAELRPAA